VKINFIVFYGIDNVMCGTCFTHGMLYVVERGLQSRQQNKELLLCAFCPSLQYFMVDSQQIVAQHVDVECFATAAASTHIQLMCLPSRYSPLLSAAIPFVVLISLT